MTGNTFYFNWEVDCMIWLQAHLGTIGTSIAKVFTFFGEELVFVVIFGILYWCLDKKAAKTIGIPLVIALIVNPMIKNIALRRRPYLDHSGIRCLKPVTSKADINDIAAQGYSFPSAHAMNSVIIYGGLYSLVRNRILRALTVILPVLVGLSRVALGVHYPTDVLAGWGLGILILFLAPYVQKNVKNENLFHLIVFLVAATGIFFCHTDDYFAGLGVMAGLFLAIPFEERFVSFEGTDRIAVGVLRVAAGFALEAGLSYLTKMPFSKDFLESGTLSANLVRSARYTVIMFILFAIYPMLFKYIDRVFRKPDAGS